MISSTRCQETVLQGNQSEKEDNCVEPHHLSASFPSCTTPKSLYRWPSGVKIRAQKGATVSRTLNRRGQSSMLAVRTYPITGRSRRTQRIV